MLLQFADRSYIFSFKVDFYIFHTSTIYLQLVSLASLLSNSIFIHIILIFVSIESNRLR